jgi:trans-2,3-dihydro-3-hydroxyanthranilate isomerase
MPFAGHPNVGTGFVLAEQGRAKDGKLLFEEIAGLVEVSVDRDGQGALRGASIAAPQPLSLGLRLPAETVAACAELTPSEVVLSSHPPLLASVGVTFVLAEVAPAALACATPRIDAFRKALAEWPALAGRLSLYLYAHDGARLRARMFAPVAGTWEDPATGSAATPLAALLLSLGTGSRVSYEIAQGVEMGRPSLLRASAWRAADGIRASVSGTCVTVLRGEALV